MTLVLCAALYLFFRFTRLGVAMQAASQNQLAAYYMGIPVRARVHADLGDQRRGRRRSPACCSRRSPSCTSTWASSASRRSRPRCSAASAACPGAIAGGLIIGVVEPLAGFYLPEGFKDVAAYIVLLVVLIVRPHGLFGDAARKKV